MMKPIRKANRVLFKELLYEEKFNQMKKGVYDGPVKVWSKKQGQKDTNSKKEKSKDQLKTTKETPNTNDLKDSKPDKKSKKKSNKIEVDTNASSIEGLNLNFNLSDNSVSDDEMEDDSSMTFNGVPYSIVETKTENLDDSNDSSDDESIGEDQNSENDASDDNGTSSDEETANSDSIKMEENDLMTQVEGIWIRKSKLSSVASLREEKKKQVLEARPDNSDAPMTLEEDKKYKVRLYLLL